MDKLLVPLILLAILTGGLFFFFIPLKKTFPPESTNSSNSTQESGKPPDVKELKTKANALIDKGEFQSALQTLDPVKGWKDPEILSLLGYAYSGIKDFPAACESFEQAIEKRRESTWIYALAFLYETNGEFSRAKPLFNELTRLKLPPSIRGKVLCGLGRSSRWDGQDRLAFKAFSSAIQLNPRDDSAFIEVFKILQTENRGLDWKSLVEKGDEYHSENFDYQFWKGSFLREIGSYDLALSAFRKCVELNSENPASFFNIYQILREKHKIEEALNELEKFLNLKAPLPYIYFQAAIDAKKEKRLGLAFRFLRKSIVYDRSLLGRNDDGVISAVDVFLMKSGTPDEKEFMKIFNSFMNGEFQSAADKMERLIQKTKNKDMIEDGKRLIVECRHVLMGKKAYQDFLARQRALELQQAGADQIPGEQSLETDTPMDELKRKAQNNPRDARMQYLAAVRLAQSGDLEGSKHFLQETLRANPHVAEAYYSLGKIAIHEKNTEKAMELLNKAVQIRPNHSQTRSYLATLLLDRGDNQKAAEEARQALYSNPSNPEARMVLAKVYIAQSNKEKALEQLEVGLECEKDPKLIEELKSLKQQLSGD